MPCFYLTPKQDDFNKIPELQVCLAEFSRFLSLLVSLAPTSHHVPTPASPRSTDQTGSGATDAIAKMDSLSGVYYVAVSI